VRGAAGAGSEGVLTKGMFKKILIANRGEIACRVIRTARRLGIGTVAVCSEADIDARHADEADEAVSIGKAPSVDSYLNMGRILEAIAKTGADAVHPGYGFLSENRAFAEALAKAGVTFIGPGSEAIAAMGDKIESKRLAREAGVSTVPGTLDPVRDAAEAVAIAEEIGFPVMLKASAAGGGKGMRLAWNAQEVEEGLVSAINEAKSAFGDDRVFIEKFIEEPRHIEIQVIGDSHGNVIHLGERECSIQRRHQKVIEEAPSPFLDPETREAMGAQAVALAKQVGYRSAGTVEFIVDKNRAFYFLEMNTRLQVEHPVTEMITGIDLVEWMIRIAAGESLPIGQADVRLRGWAVESRIYAEDPVRGFLPSTGRLVRYVEPDPVENAVRVDSGVVEGSEISIHYDPMIAKLVTAGETREQAVERMAHALDAFYLHGIGNNIAFLGHVIAHPRFRDGRLSTGFIDDEYPDGFSDVLLQPEEPDLLAAIATYIQAFTDRRDAAVEGAVDAVASRETAHAYVAFVGAKDPVELDMAVTGESGSMTVASAEAAYEIQSTWSLGDPVFVATVNGAFVVAQVARRGMAHVVRHHGRETEVRVLSAHAAALARLMPYKEPPDMSRFLLSPMPGLLVRVSAAPGDQVKAGQELAVVEAMKMENILRAEQDGVVATLHAEAGESLEVDQAILEFE